MPSIDRLINTRPLTRSGLKIYEKDKLDNTMYTHTVQHTPFKKHTHIHTSIGHGMIYSLLLISNWTSADICT